MPKKATPKAPHVVRLIYVHPDLDTKIRIKLIKEKARLKPKGLHTLMGLTRGLYEEWLAGRTKL